MGTLRTILVADDEASIRHVLTLVLSDKGYDVRAVADGEEALKELQARPYDVVISDVRMPRLDGMSLLKAALAAQPDLTFLVMSAYGSEDQALEAVRLGAWDYVQKPFKPEEVVLVLQKAEERNRLVRENVRLKKQAQGGAGLERLQGVSDPMKALQRQLTKVAPAATTVLITGESGTGKELVARAIHDLSLRASGPFVPVNCSAIPEGLIESELFGHAKGAFTDARQAKRGLVSEADGGTLFLDEVGELPAAMQVKLLRFLQEGEVRPVGENRTEKIDVRVVAATLRDLSKLIERGVFREDLYFRLNVVNLKVPPLRDRGQDVMVLARSMLARFNRELNREVRLEGFSPEAEAAMLAYAWPGNVRELENAIERATLLAEGNQVTLEALPEKLWTAVPGSGAKGAPSTASPSGAPGLPSVESQSYSLKRAMRELEETFIRAALRRTRGNRTRAAELLEISHRALLYKIKDYGIDADLEGEQGP